jgi:chromosome partitioning protein
VALPSRDLHRRLPEIAQADDVVIIDTPQLEDHAAIALSALRYADEIVIPCAPSPIEINRTTPVREEITEVAEARDRPARSAVLLNRYVARAHSTADAREALASLDYDVLGTAVPRLEVYAQSFGRPVPGTGRQVWRRVARDLIERCPPPCPVRSGPPGHHPAQAVQDQPRPSPGHYRQLTRQTDPATIDVPHRRSAGTSPWAKARMLRALALAHGGPGARHAGSPWPTGARSYT